MFSSTIVFALISYRSSHQRQLFSWSEVAKISRQILCDGYSQWPIPADDNYCGGQCAHVEWNIRLVSTRIKAVGSVEHWIAMQVMYRGPRRWDSWSLLNVPCLLMTILAKWKKPYSHLSHWAMTEVRADFLTHQAHADSLLLVVTRALGKKNSKGVLQPTSAGIQFVILEVESEDGPDNISVCHKACRSRITLSMFRKRIGLACMWLLLEWIHW